MDFGLVLYGYSSQYPYLHFALRTGEFEENWANKEEHILLFRNLMNIDEFRDQFIDRLAVYMGDFFNYNYGSQVIDSLKSNIAYEYPYHKSNYGSYNWWLNWDNEVAGMKNWMSERTYFLYNYLKSFFSLGDVFNLRIKNMDNEDEKVFVSINNTPVRNQSFDGKFFQNRMIVLSGETLDEEKAVTGWNLTKVRYGRQINDYISGETVQYICEEGTSSLTIIPVVGEKTDINNIYAGYAPEIFISDNGLMITSLSESCNIRISDIQGRIVFRNTISQNEIFIPLPKDRIYIVSITSEKGTYNKKVIL